MKLKEVWFKILLKILVKEWNHFNIEMKLLNDLSN